MLSYRALRLLRYTIILPKHEGSISTRFAALSLSVHLKFGLVLLARLRRGVVTRQCGDADERDSSFIPPSISATDDTLCPAIIIQLAEIHHVFGFQLNLVGQGW